jgi:glycosyltransferase involved in cell wall biosynthesis
MKLLVGVHAGSYSGIDSYAEQVAAAASTAGFEVTLLATDGAVARVLQGRLGPTRISVEHLALPVLSSRAALIERLWPTAAVRRVSRALRAYVSRSAASHSVWHLNRPALALAVRGHAERICVAGWFYPHQALGRLRETWRHVGGEPLRRAVIAAKSLDFYRWDEAGYAAADWIVTPTELLAEQLRTQGRRALACPPPASVPDDLGSDDRPGGVLRFLVCSGDLGHPRKNLGEAVAALADLADRRGPVILTAIGRNPEVLERLARRHAPRVRLEALGPLEPARVRQVMQGCAALLFPSRYEEWGYVAVESLLCGTPVVTYPVYPFAEMLSGGLGVVADGLGPSNFAAAIERSLGLVRGSDLRALAAARFGSTAVGERLAPLWRGEAPSGSGPGSGV